MQKLRERMHSRQVYNQSVCNCHEDSELVRIVIRSDRMRMLSADNIADGTVLLSVVDH